MVGLARHGNGTGVRQFGARFFKAGLVCLYQEQRQLEGLGISKLISCSPAWNQERVGLLSVLDVQLSIEAKVKYSSVVEF